MSSENIIDDSMNLVADDLMNEINEQRATIFFFWKKSCIKLSKQQKNQVQ
jgi:hypothetical protein